MKTERGWFAAHRECKVRTDKETPIGSHERTKQAPLLTLISPLSALYTFFSFKYVARFLLSVNSTCNFDASVPWVEQLRHWFQWKGGVWRGRMQPRCGCNHLRVRDQDTISVFRQEAAFKSGRFTVFTVSRLHMNTPACGIHDLWPWNEFQGFGNRCFQISRRPFHFSSDWWVNVLLFWSLVWVLHVP